MKTLDETIELLSKRMFGRYMDGSYTYRQIEELWIVSTIYGVDKDDLAARINAGFDAMLYGE